MSTTLPISVPVKTLPVMVGGCQGTQFGCCPDGVTSKSDQNGSNCTTSPPPAQLPVGGCQGTQFGCCPDGVTSKSDQNGSNCTTSPPPAQLEPIPPAQVGGCKGTQFGCCPDGVTSKSDQNGSNCTNSTSNLNTTSNSSTDSTESIVNGYFIKIFFIITITYFVSLVIWGMVYLFDRFNVFFVDGGLFNSFRDKIDNFFKYSEYSNSYINSINRYSVTDKKLESCRQFFSKMVFFFFVPVILALFYVSNTKDKNIFETLLMIFSIVDIVVTILLIGLIIYDKKRRHTDNFRDQFSLYKSESESDDYPPVIDLTKQPSFNSEKNKDAQSSSTTSLPRKKDISSNRKTTEIRTNSSKNNQDPLYSDLIRKNLEKANISMSRNLNGG